MESALQDFLTTSVFAFMLIFMRLGTAFMVMPGTGDSFVAPQVRLLFSLSVAFVLYPSLMPYIPDPLPNVFGMFSLIAMEFIIGLFFGGVSRIFMVALDTAGMVISTASGLGNAQVFNPTLATQGSVVGSFLAVMGVTLLFVTNLHHLLIMGIYESYELFPLGSLPESGSMVEFLSRSLAASFAIGVKFAAPYIVVMIMIYTGMGVLSRLMPQIQVFILAVPIQVLISIMLMAMTLSAAMLYWITNFEQGMIYFLRVIGA
ncbi:MAG: flagellar biosynthetic protein FliR [Micavibrio sp.]|nr:flagellar biosynthetic protein FliR [Micavibrio sp.]|tara:strand:- start:382 stop:1161 length:780 start_codon:yes stop_codon:yes gene_type:complete